MFIYVFCWYLALPGFLGRTACLAAGHEISGQHCEALHFWVRDTGLPELVMPSVSAEGQGFLEPLLEVACLYGGSSVVPFGSFQRLCEHDAEAGTQFIAGVGPFLVVFVASGANASFRTSGRHYVNSEDSCCSSMPLSCVVFYKHAVASPEVSYVVPFWVVYYNP